MLISISFFCSSEVKERNSQWIICIEKIEKKYLTAFILTSLFLRHFCSFLLDIFSGSRYSKIINTDPFLKQDEDLYKISSRYLKWFMSYPLLNNKIRFFEKSQFENKHCNIFCSLDLLVYLLHNLLSLEYCDSQ